METLSWLLKHELYFPCEIQEKVMLWNTDDGKLAKHGLALRVDESSLILTHNGYLASPAFQFLKITTPEQASLHGTTHKASSYCILELQENDCIAFSAEKSSIYIRDTHIGSLITTLSGHGDAVLALVELRNGNLASGSSDKTIKIWNADDWSLERTLDEPHECAEVLSLAVLKNGLLASGSSQGSILVWNAETGELVKSFKAHESEVCSLVVLQNGCLASAGRDKAIKIWDTVSFSLMRNIGENDFSVRSLVVLKNGCLGSLDASGMVKIWNSETGCLVRSLEGNENVESLLVLASDYLVGFEKEIYIFLPYS
jgi:WD40 repeat protein